MGLKANSATHRTDSRSTNRWNGGKNQITPLKDQMNKSLSEQNKYGRQQQILTVRLARASSLFD